MAVRALQHPACQRLSVLLYFITGTNTVNTSRLLWKEMCPWIKIQTTQTANEWKDHSKYAVYRTHNFSNKPETSVAQFWYCRGAQSPTISLNLLVNSYNYLLYLWESANNNEIYLQVVKMCLSHAPKICQFSSDRPRSRLRQMWESNCYKV